MLGRIEESGEALTMPCKCEKVSKCQISECECLDYCQYYSGVYEDIKKAPLTKQGFLTFNPKPLTETQYRIGLYHDYERFKTFHRNYIKYNDNIIKYIYVAELTQKGQLHFHLYFSFKNKVSIIKQMIQPMYHEGNILMLWGSCPKLGIHYLFKTCKTMKEYFEDKEPVLPNGLSIDTPISV